MSQTIFSSRMCGGRVCLLHILLIFLALTKDCVGSQELKSPALDFNRHSLVQPTIHHGRTKREILSTRDTNGVHHSEVQVTVPIDGEQWVLELRLNEELVAGGHTLQYQQGGETVQHKPKKEELDLCHYSGSVRGKPQSWVAVSTCHGVRGVIFDGKKMRYIEPAQGPEIQSLHYLYDHNDLNTENHCGYRGGVTNNTKYDPELSSRHHGQREIKKSRVSRYKRETDNTQVRGPYNANKLSRYVELVLVADHREFQANGDNIRTVHSQLIQVANIINSVYSPLNIYIALVGVVVWSERDEIRLEENGDITLTNFLTYRERKLVTDIPNDNAHLLTRQKFSDGVVGKALKGPMCTFKFSGGVATNHSEVIGLVATTIAHEMGHNFGMEHDTDEDCECPDEKCIMSPSSTSVVPVHWSSCSLKSLALSFERGMDYCLRNKPKRLFDSPNCGNGFIEPGEQCDCGITAGGGTNPCHACCHPDTCMLRSNATCGAGACCDLTTCRPKSAGAVCRSAERECDLPEYCTGHSEYCPADVYKMDSIPCGVGLNQAYCVRGACRSHTDQCRLLWGTTGESSHLKCYTNSNTKGTKNGNCGYQVINQVYKPCATGDALCGLLQCRHLNERLEFGMESVAFLSAMFINDNGTIIPCRTAIIDLGVNDVDPGLVPDGARCGHERMCLKQKCVSVESVREGISAQESSVCPSNCSGHGICNSEGHCHCEAGFAPPLCAAPGPGGSIDSGPATDPSVQRNFMIAMYVIFLGIIPSIILLLFLVYYSRHNVLLWWKKPRKSYVHYFTCCSKNNSKFSDRFQNSTSSLRHLLSFKSKRNNLDDVCEKEEHIYESIDKIDKFTVMNNNKNTTKTVMAVKQDYKKPLTKPLRKINKDDIQVATGDVKVRLLNSPKKVNKDNIQVVTGDVKLNTAKPLIKINKSDIHLANTTTNGFNPKPVNLNDYMNVSEIKTANDAKPNPMKPMVKINKSDIHVANANNVSVRPINLNLNKQNVTQIATNGARLKPVKPIANSNIHVANANNVHLNMNKEAQNQIATSGINLKPINPAKNNKDNQIGNNSVVDMINNGVKLKPVKPIVKNNKATQLASDVKLKPVKKMNKADVKIAASDVKLASAKSVVDAKPSVSQRRPNIDPAVMIVKRGLSSTTNDMLNKGRLFNAGRNV